MLTVNNAAASLFSNLQMTIGGREITTNQTHFNYKCYLQNLLSFNDTAKVSNLHLAGWFNDKAWQNEENGGEWTTNASLSNLGLKNRISWFKSGFKADASPYRPGGYTFLAPFRHELHGVTKPIPPGIAVTFILDLAKDSFYLMRVPKPKASISEDTENYKFQVQSCMLFVKVAHMSLPLYRELHARIQHNPIRYFFRKLHMHVETINGNAESVQTNVLNPDKSSPIKIYFALVSTAAYIGDYLLNPYCFVRHFSVKQPDGLFASSGQKKDSDELNRRLSLIEAKQQITDCTNEQKQKLLKYKLKLLHQKEKLSRLQSLIATQRDTTQIAQCDGTNSDDDSDFEVSELSDDEEEETSLTQRQTRSQGLCEPGPSKLSHDSTKENLIESFTHFLNIPEVSESVKSDPLEVMKLFVKLQDSGKGKLNPRRSAKSSKRKLTESDVSQYYSAGETEPEDIPAQSSTSIGDAAKFKESFISAFELEIDSQPVDTLKIISTADECPEAYMRFLSKYKRCRRCNMNTSVTRYI